MAETRDYIVIAVVVREDLAQPERLRSLADAHSWLIRLVIPRIRQEPSSGDPFRRAE